jgi:hypothetical protein
MLPESRICKAPGFMNKSGGSPRAPETGTWPFKPVYPFAQSQGSPP